MKLEKLDLDVTRSNACTYKISHEMFNRVMTMAKPGVTERELVGQIEDVVQTHGCQIV